MFSFESVTVTVLGFFVFSCLGDDTVIVGTNDFGASAIPVYPSGSPGTSPGISAPPTSRNYVCVPVGTCSGGTIDIRIVTPGNQQQDPCPVGQEPCYNFGNNTNPCSIGTTQCGTRLVSISNTADGFAQRGAFPWQAFLVNQSGYAGSGVLLDPYHVLTAAHKVEQYSSNPGSLSVYMGIWETTDTSTAQQRTVSRIVIHPQYNRNSLKNDLAVLRLSTCYTLVGQNSINTACLPSQSQNFIGQNCMVSGWGQTNFRLNDAPTMRQKQVTVPIVSYATCRASFSQSNLLGNNVDYYLDAAGEICAGGQSMKDACTQDGGAPLVCMNNGRYSVVGLVIWGKGCGAPGVYGVYTNVAYYVNWIQNTLATT